MYGLTIAVLRSTRPQWMTTTEPARVMATTFTVIIGNVIDDGTQSTVVPQLHASPSTGDRHDDIVPAATASEVATISIPDPAARVRGAPSSASHHAFSAASRRSTTGSRT